jgi:MarR family
MHNTALPWRWRTTGKSDALPQSQEETVANIRAIAQSLALAAKSANAHDLDAPNLDIAALTAGLDPNVLNSESPEFRAGAAAALSSVLSALADQMLSMVALEVLRKRHRARVLSALASRPGLTQKKLAELLQLQESNLSVYLRELSQTGFVEPAPPVEGWGKAWSLTSWGISRFLDLVDGQLAGLVPEDELELGIRGALTLAAARRSSQDTRSGEASEVGFAATGLPFVLAEPNEPEIVLIHNANLDAWLPPGGHFHPELQEIPSEKVVRKIKEETGATSEILWRAPRFETRTTAKPLPGPSFVLLEDLRELPGGETELHTYHHDFNYICRVTDESVREIGTGSSPAVRVNLSRLPEGTYRAEAVRRRIAEAITETHREHERAIVTDDVIDRVVQSLTLLEANRPGEESGRLQVFTPHGAMADDQVESALKGQLDEFGLVVNASINGESNSH